MSEQDAVAVATPEPTTDFSLHTILGGDPTPVPTDPAQAEADAKAHAAVTVDLTQAEPAPSPSPEATPGEDPAAAQPQGTASETEEEPEAPKEKPMSKHEKEKFKLREQRNKERAEKEQIAKELADLKAQYAIEPEEPEVDPNAEAIHRARMQERVKLSEARFLERDNGAALFAEKFASADSPWADIEARAKAGEAKASQLVARATQAIDPYAEAFNILEEQDLFEQYGTTSMTRIIAKALAEEEEAMEKRILAKIQKPVADIGSATKTLGRVTGHIPPSQPQSGEEVSPPKQMFGQK